MRTLLHLQDQIEKNLDCNSKIRNISAVGFYHLHSGVMLSP